MTSSAWALQTAAKAALAGDAGLIALFGGTPAIHDRVPTGAAQPYLAFADWRIEEADTDDARVDAHSFTVQVWSNYAGLKEVKAIAALVEAVLHGAHLSLGGFALVDLSVAGTAFSQDEREGLAVADTRFRALTQAN